MVLKLFSKCHSHHSLSSQCATKKRPSQPPSLLGKDPKSEENTKLKGMLAEQLAKVLLKKNMGGISEYALHCLGKLSSMIIINLCNFRLTPILPAKASLQSKLYPMNDTCYWGGAIHKRGQQNKGERGLIFF